MKLKLEHMSSKYTVKQFTEEDISNIYEICIGNPSYYEYMKTEPTYENITDIFTELPPNTALEDKYFVGFYEANQLIAILDIVTGYPNAKTAFIGWFMMKKELQGTEIGSRIISEVISCLEEEKFHYAQLGYIKGNQQSENFWRKNKFYPIGREKETRDYIIVVMQREVGKGE